MWIPLHQHSQYSILDASSPIEGIVKKAKEFGMPAAALTDHGNMYGAIDFYKACHAADIKPLIGCEVYVAPHSRFDKKKISSQTKTAFHLVLIAKDAEGYHNLCRLVSLGFLEGFYYHPRVDKELLQKYSKGLICLSACLSGMVAHAALHEKEEVFYQEIAWHRDLFGEDFYLELQRHKMAVEKEMLIRESWLKQEYQNFIQKQETVNARLIEASGRLGIKLVATNDTHYLESEDCHAHEILLNIQSGEPVEIWEKDSRGNATFRIPNPKRRVYASSEFYFKSPQEMQERFSDVPEAISNTLEIAQKCHLSLDFKTKHYPVFIPPEFEKIPSLKQEREKVAEQFLKKLCEENISRRYTTERLEKIAQKYPGKDPQTIVRERLDWELEVVISKGMCDYLLIVWDFINWAKNQHIPVGPGRGSGAGSIILYLIGVTDIEPLRFHLFFERFINPERVSYPDIDVDICMDRRAEVIDYTVKKYGKENVAQIITFGTMKARMTIKDVGRVLSVPLTKVNQIAKLVPEDPQMTLAKALEVDPDLNRLYLQDEETKRILDLGKKLEGSIRNTGIHAAGLIICGEPLMEHIPICLAKDSEMAATQYSMKPVEAVGMLKIDFLGLKTLTSIQRAVHAIRKNRGIEIDWVNLSLEDGPTFKLLQEGRTSGVFQMESGGMQELSRELSPDKFEEIIAIGALYRPGPMEMIPSFISRKHGKEAIEYDHPWMQTILEETYGIMVYQEQVMQIAQTLANYTLGEGDVLRKAMGKKDTSQMAQEREKFSQGAIANGISKEIATAIFDKIEKFASYGFNKSHAAAYGYLTYVTAYLKANFPKEWMSALMTCDRDDISKVAKWIQEAQEMGIQILPPDVNEGGREFAATEKGIRFAMTGIKGVGEGVVEAILEEREKRGAFVNFYNFFKRIDLKRVGKKAIESLVEAGSFDFTGWSRDALVMRIEEMYETASKTQKERDAGILSLFSLMGDEGEKRFEKSPEVKNPALKNDILKREKELLGFYLTGHPMDAYKHILHRLSCVRLNEIEAFEHGKVFRAAFIIETAETKISSKNQKKFAILKISDGLQSFELPIWSELYEAKSALLVENQLLYAIMQIDKREESIRLSCRWLEDLTQVDEKIIEACDQAFDKARAQSASRLSFTSKAIEKKEVVVDNKRVIVTLDAHRTRLSHILKLKEILRGHRGKSAMELSFYANEHRLGVLHIEGVQPSAALEKSLRELPGYQTNRRNS